MARSTCPHWGILDSAVPGLLLLLWQHDDLPDLLHEVSPHYPMHNLTPNIFRQNGSPDLTYADFIIVQSVWGMTQGIIMPLSGFVIR